MDLGASRRGVDMGPSALRVAGLQTRLKQLGRQVEDIGNISVKQPEEQHFGERNAKYLDEIAETCRGLADIVKKTLDEDEVPLVGRPSDLPFSGASALPRLSYERFTDRTIDSDKRLAEVLVEVRAQGFAVDDQERNVG